MIFGPQGGGQQQRNKKATVKLLVGAGIRTLSKSCFCLHLTFHPFSTKLCFCLHLTCIVIVFGIFNMYVRRIYRLFMFER